MAVLPDFQALFRTMPSPYMVLDRDLRYVAVNDAYLATTGCPMNELIGSRLFDRYPGQGASGQLVRESLARVLATGKADPIEVIAYAVPRGAEGGLEKRFWSVVHSPLFDAAGEVAFICQSAVDITERIHAQEQQKLLIDELNHRVKNALATVQSIAAQTLRGAKDAEGFHRAFEARLMALSATHDLLTATAWRGALLGDVIAREVQPYGLERYELDGPTVELSPGQALTLGLVFHELTTNAAKHGALSSARGQVKAIWRVEPARTGEELHVVWTETGGPPVKPPTRRGFGSRLIERALIDEAGGDAELEFDPAGLICRMRAPLEHYGGATGQ